MTLLKKMLVCLVVIILSLSITFVLISRNKGIICVKCNIILISIDTFRADHIKSYGYFRDTTPNIDKLAIEGIQFQNTFSPAPNTLPSHMSIFTSLYPTSHGVKVIYKDRLEENIRTLPKILQENGYNTLWLGVQTSPFIDPDVGFGRGFDRLDERPWQYGIEIINNIGDSKFFIFMHDFNLHFPYLPKEVLYDVNYDGEIFGSRSEFEKALFKEISKRFKEEPEFIEDIFGKENIIKYKDWFIEGYNEDKFKHEMFFNMTQSQTRNLTLFRINEFRKRINYTKEENKIFLQALYDSKIKSEDELIGKLLTILKNNNLLSNTVIIITSDHGEEFTEHGNYDHSRTLYDESLHVPLIIYNPKGPKGKKIESLTESIDIAPTILDLVGGSIPKIFQGESLLELIKDDKDFKEKEYIFSEWRKIKAIRSKKWKLIVNEDKEDELYNLIKDPLEQDNVLIKHPKIVIELRNELERWERGQDTPSKRYKFPEWLDSETKRKIIETGYP